MNGQNQVGIEMGDKRGYNRTEVLNYKGVRMDRYPEAHIKAVSAAAFETAMARLKSHEDGEVRALAEAADAAFLLWQLAGEETALATQTIGEWMPVVVGIRHISEGA